MTEEPPARLAKLRPIQQADLPDLMRFWWDPEAIGEHDWFGFRMSSALDFERRWHQDGLTGEESSFLAVETDEGACAGWVTWRVLPTRNVEIGIALLPSIAALASEPMPSGASCTTCSARPQCTGSRRAPRSTTPLSRRRSNGSGSTVRACSAAPRSAADVGVTASCTGFSATTCRQTPATTRSRLP